MQLRYFSYYGLGDNLRTINTYFNMFPGAVLVCPDFVKKNTELPEALTKMYPGKILFENYDRRQFKKFAYDNKLNSGAENYVKHCKSYLANESFPKEVTNLPEKFVVLALGWSSRDDFGDFVFDKNLDLKKQNQPWALCRHVSHNEEKIMTEKFKANGYEVLTDKNLSLEQLAYVMQRAENVFVVDSFLGIFAMTIPGVAKKTKVLYRTTEAATYAPLHVVTFPFYRNSGAELIFGFDA